jgi:intracellular septation protein A
VAVIGRLWQRESRVSITKDMSEVSSSDVTDSPSLDEVSDADVAREQDDQGNGLGHRHPLVPTMHLPHPKAFVRHALPPVIESTIGPAILFYVVLVTAGFRGAIIAALVWSYLAFARRILRRERVPGLLLLSITLISLRTAVSFITGSSFIYFAQPTLGTALVAVLFLLSVISRRPLAERLAHDFCPLDPDMMSRPFLRQFFLRLSLLWFAVLAVNAGFVMWLLVESSLRSFVIERMLVSTLLTTGGIVLSTLWFLRVMRGAGIAVRWNRALHPIPAKAPTA